MAASTGGDHRTSYGIDEFWAACSDLGLRPHFVMLEPEEAVIGERYAYFVLTKP